MRDGQLRPRLELDGFAHGETECMQKVETLVLMLVASSAQSISIGGEGLSTGIVHT